MLLVFDTFLIITISPLVDLTVWSSEFYVQRVEEEDKVKSQIEYEKKPGFSGRKILKTRRGVR